MACPTGMDIENDFLKMFESIQSYKTETNGLMLLDGKRQVLARFVAPAQTSNRPVQTKTFVYQCAAGYRFVARVDGEKAWLYLPEKTIKLTVVANTNGEKYHDGNTTYHIRGNQAQLTYNTVRHEECLNNARAAIWEHAKLDGVDFRAVGNEPSWILQITAGGEISLTTGYGANRYRFATPEPKIEKEHSRTVYETGNNSHTLKILLSAEPCKDTMVDESNETSVTLWLDEKKYTGCGRPLH